MKIKAALVAALMSLSSLAAADDINIDITNHPDKDFLLGYEHDYQGGCKVVWFESRWNTEHIVSVGGCPGISQDRVLKDMMNEMEYVKSKNKFSNFSEYFRDLETKAAPRPKRVPIKCVETASGVYIFLPAEAHNKPGWRYISKIYSGRSLQSDIVGFWRKNDSGAIIADFGLSLTNINMDNVKDCQNL